MTSVVQFMLSLIYEAAVRAWNTESDRPGHYELLCWMQDEWDLP